MTRELIVQIHAYAGVIILITGILQMILKKGGKLHRIIGNVYFYAWLPLIVTGAYIGGYLITIVGIFGFYFALTGARIGHLKNKGIQLFDKIIFGVSFLLALLMLYYAIRLFMIGQTSFAIIFAVFGGIFFISTLQDIRKFILKQDRSKIEYGQLDWYFEHLTRMIISFIAATTAFASIQNLFGENTLNFLLPTVVGTIAIIFIRRSYIQKFKLEKK
ncbi:DUF2306 domain-containing protein [Crocinitomix catalasitica]|uniref:hypothetical protein n=1 Tax=Crocinitomix catalasitica TaxID=184607 RepID=UPI000483654F|nr:hypothetical protein [Crocinitomix catalasitica]